MRTKKLSLVVVPLLLTACSQNDVLQQDVYNHQYDCLQDWPFALCEAHPIHAIKQPEQYNLYVGPQYYKKNRKVCYSGRLTRASGKHDNGTPIIAPPPAPNAKSTPIMRGGFGCSNNSSGGG